MENYLRDPIQVPIEKLFPDPNNPRLALEDAPGYSDVDALFDEGRRKEILDEIGAALYGIDDLVTTICGQGWMPIDNILVWRHPDDDEERYVVSAPAGNSSRRKAKIASSLNISPSYSAAASVEIMSFVGFWRRSASRAAK